MQQHIRLLKIMFACICGFMALFYVLQNIANINAAHSTLIYVLSGQDHQIYPETLFFKSASPILAWFALVIIIALELAAAFLLLKGTWHMFKARNQDTFNDAKKWAQIGAGIGVFVWFGLFGVIGSAFFQMWQTAAGTNSMNGAFQFFVSCAITLFWISQKDE
ncbi:DUF2165 family protein [Thalassotalea sp. PS06]|uniref:DUF2165 family protein n=1 Tax=Thalassotalea sp. PS06 TaxID=2594005 RepID=UPI001161E64E|nr:DUF2165 family protein [Thalassotalea sp. PS06]QDP02118.1 DUF2165 domain-containing protein [Thalassotalea sp. PS06]